MISAARFAAIRAALGLTPRQLARVLRLNPKSGQRHIVGIERGEETASGPVSVAMEALASGWRPADWEALTAEPLAMAA